MCLRARCDGKQSDTAGGTPLLFSISSSELLFVRPVLCLFKFPPILLYSFYSFFLLVLNGAGEGDYRV